MDLVDLKSIEILDGLVDAIQSISQLNLQLRNLKNELEKLDLTIPENQLNHKEIKLQYIKNNRKKQRILQILVDIGRAQPISMHTHGKGRTFVNVEFDNQRFYVFYHIIDSKKLGLKSSGTMPTAQPLSNEEIENLMPQDQALKILKAQYKLFKPYIDSGYQSNNRNFLNFDKTP